MMVLEVSSHLGQSLRETLALPLDEFMLWNRYILNRKKEEQKQIRALQARSAGGKSRGR